MNLFSVGQRIGNVRVPLHPKTLLNNLSIKPGIPFSQFLVEQFKGSYFFVCHFVDVCLSQIDFWKFLDTSRKFPSFRVFFYGMLRGGGETFPVPRINTHFLQAKTRGTHLQNSCRSFGIFSPFSPPPRHVNPISGHYLDSGTAQRLSNSFH